MTMRPKMSQHISTRCAERAARGTGLTLARSADAGVALLALSSVVFAQTQPPPPAPSAQPPAPPPAQTPNPAASPPPPSPAPQTQSPAPAPPPQRPQAASSDLPVPPASAAPKDDGQWSMPSKNYAATRYSDLDQINGDTVKNLRVEFTFSTGNLHGEEAA